MIFGFKGDAEGDELDCGILVTALMRFKLLPKFFLCPVVIWCWPVDTLEPPLNIELFKVICCNWTLWEFCRLHWANWQGWWWWLLEIKRIGCRVFKLEHNWAIVCELVLAKLLVKLPWNVGIASSASVVDAFANTGWIWEMVLYEFEPELLELLFGTDFGM